MVNPQPHFFLHLVGSFLAGYVDRQAAQQQRWADPMLGDDSFGVLAQRVFDHLQLFEGLSIAHKVFLGSWDLKSQAGQHKPAVFAQGFLNATLVRS